MNPKTKSSHRVGSTSGNPRTNTERKRPATKRQINARVPDAETHTTTLPSSVVEMPASQDTIEKVGDVRKNPAPRFDPSKLRIQFCPAAKAERIAKGAVLRSLRLRAKSKGKKVSGGTESIVGPKRCADVRWLWTTLNQMADEFAGLIDQDLERLNQPGADREMLVELIYVHLLCIRATVTIFMGDDTIRKAPHS